MENDYKSLVAKYGIFLGVVLSLITVLVYALSPILFTKWWLGIILTLIVIVFAIVAVMNAKKLIPGLLNFKQAFTAYFIPVALGTFISMIVSIVLFNYVDPETAEYLNEERMEMTEEMLQKLGAPQESINEELAEMEGTNPFGIKTSFTNFIYQLAFFSLIGLIVALIFRQKDPNKA